jgi:hypothetical protein
LEKISFGDPLLVLRQAKIMRTALLNINADKLGKAFESFINNFPYQNQPYNENYFRALFLSAMFFAKMNIRAEDTTSDGRIDTSIYDPKEGYFIIEFKYLHHSNEISKRKQSPATIASIKDEMEKLAILSLTQVDIGKYTSKFMGGGKIYKGVIIVSGHSDVLVKLTEETINFL